MYIESEGGGMYIEGELRVKVSAEDIRSLLTKHIEKHLYDIGIDPRRVDIEPNFYSTLDYTVKVRPRLIDGADARLTAE